MTQTNKAFSTYLVCTYFNMLRSLLIFMLNLVVSFAEHGSDGNGS